MKGPLRIHSVSPHPLQSTCSLFEQIEDQINRTDTKARVALAADTIMLGWLSTQTPNTVQAVFGCHVSAGGEASRS